jgi:hypothetical protein
VYLLERYRESQSSDDARTRYDARLSKARALLARQRTRDDDGALTSVRKSLRRPRRRRLGGASTCKPLDVRVPDADLQPLTSFFALRSAKAFDAQPGRVLTDYIRDARGRGRPLEELVQGLRLAARNATAASLSESERATRYSSALIELLAQYFDED